MYRGPSFELELFLFGLISQTEKILRRSKLNLDEMFVLVYIRRFGETFGSGKAILRRDVTAVMRAVFDRRDSAISKCLYGLFVKDFLSESTLAPSQKIGLFGTATGYKKLVVLTKRGLKKTEEFDREIDRLLLSFMPTNAASLTQETFKEICEEFASEARAKLIKPR